MTKAKTTPMIQQYLSIKERYSDAILFYRMGDFYEMFFEDAQTASRVLDITLTSRNKKDAVPVPMCGVPYRAAQSYLSRLIESGYKVAICDQVEDPATAKGLVKREVVRVVTPGMIIEDDLLDAKTNNFILALNINKTHSGFAYMDISTGTFRVAESKDRSKVLQEIQSIDPKEVLVSAGIEQDPFAKEVQARLGTKVINWVDAYHFDVRRGRKRLTEQFQTMGLEGFGCQRFGVGLGAAGALLHYVEETQKQSVTHLKGIEVLSLDDHLVIDPISRRNLELESNLRDGSRYGTLVSVLDKTVTAMGGRCLKQWLHYPLKAAAAIGQRLDAVEEALTHSDLRRRLVVALDDIYDLERLNSKISMGHANGRDVTALKISLMALPSLWSVLENLRSELYSPPLKLDRLTKLAELIHKAIREEAPPSINDGGMIRRGYDEQLDELIRISQDSKGYLAQLEVREREATGINTLKVRYNKVFGYYIEVSKTQSDSVPAHYVRKQTLVNAERYITDELKQFENKVLGAEEQRCTLELELFRKITEQVVDAGDEIQKVATYLGQLDCLLCLAEIADQNDYQRPGLNTQGVISIIDGRHPVVEKMVAGERFVPNTIEMDDDKQQILVITGPNMAGKSTILRQVALMVIMAQLGSFIPAAKANIAITDRIFTRVGALDNLAAGQSTFMVEMEETANILNNATNQSLVIMDEIGRGTSTFDGLSIAWAVVEHLHDVKGSGVKTLFATHYHELTELAATRKRVANFNIAVKEWNDRIIFLRKLVPGGTNRSYGIQVARLAGIPVSAIERAKVILNRIESDTPTGANLTDGGGGVNGATSGPVQMDLFRPLEQELVEELQRLDLNNTTPIQALQVLMDLQVKSKKSDGA
jgi:DNA mismatch repair protein MutS